MTENEFINSRYQKVAIGIAQRIAEGKFSVGEKIKSRSTIASTFNVSPETARKAINVLVDLDILEVRQGSGAIVVSKENAIAYMKQFDISNSLKSLGHDIQSNLKQQKKEMDKLSNLVQNLLDQSSLIKKEFPFEPYELTIGEFTHEGKSLQELNIWQHTGATVIAVKKQGNFILSPDPLTVLTKGDQLFFVGNDMSSLRMQHFFNS
ncbi:TrkA C-terminal domain-containing protein [Streptococcus sp. CSL10205-OR2]|uniref:TrkA C-terminal domain-containing protein n=1 Tax=Streptococcus sp. CSL10205-OR2 TaxID=2980558 RepID=UPI0021D9A0DD|nr:TrkA C-terminal domain-containing protein [Streptococcus sp. CSL10205-OR2]MCU9533259.1 GntR family transcriptional regulator [Streptococcus sp. CSL10205-OR2]